MISGGDEAGCSTLFIVSSSFANKGRSASGDDLLETNCRAKAVRTGVESWRSKGIARRYSHNAVRGANGTLFFRQSQIAKMGRGEGARTQAGFVASVDSKNRECYRRTGPQSRKKRGDRAVGGPCRHADSDWPDHCFQNPDASPSKGAGGATVGDRADRRGLAKDFQLWQHLFQFFQAFVSGLGLAKIQLGQQFKAADDGENLVRALGVGKHQ